MHLEHNRRAEYGKSLYSVPMSRHGMTGLSIWGLRGTLPIFLSDVKARHLSFIVTSYTVDSFSDERVDVVRIRRAYDAKRSS